jgi:hypothetical protein
VRNRPPGIRALRQTVVMYALQTGGRNTRPAPGSWDAALKVCRMSVLRLRPPRFAAGISGSISAHSASVTSLGVAQLIAIVSCAVFYRPHRRLPRIGSPPLNHK